MKLTLCSVVLLCFIGCSSKVPKGFKAIENDGFTIQVSEEWKYEELEGIDSFVGQITGDGIELNFDWSEMGYANHLMPTPREFVYEYDYEWMPTIAPYSKPGVTYTSGDVEGTRKQIMEREGITDPSLVKVEPFQIPEREIILEDGHYMAVLIYKDTTVHLKIEIPEAIKEHVIQVDTVGRYKRKIIQAKSDSLGYTGIYLEDLKSNFNFNMVGVAEGKENQEKAVNAFRTIRIKR